MGVSRQDAFSIITAYVSIALVLQFLFVIWMILGMKNFAGVSVRKEVKKSLLWVQLLLFVIGFAFFIWSEIAYSIIGAGDNLVGFCTKVYSQVASFFTGMFRTCFMVFLLLKLRATRMSEKTGKVEKFSLGLTVLSFILIFFNIFTQKGGLLPRFGGMICFQESNQLLMGILILMDFFNGALCLYEFNRRLKEVSKAVRESVALTPATGNSGSNSSSGNQTLEKIARDSKNAGGGAILFYLANYIFTFAGLYVFKGDEVILFVGFVNVMTIVLMSYVIAYFTRSVWVVEGRSPLGKFYSAVASDKNTQSQEQKTTPQMQAASADGPKSASQNESVGV
jgi:hypothetical protein